MEATVKSKVVKDFRTHERDTGSTDVQVALLTARINELTEHLQKNKNRIRNDIDMRCRDLCEAVGSSSTTFVTDRDVAFLVTSRGAKSNLWASQAVSSHGVKHGLKVGEVVA